jgi:predicted RNase H-like HicB family nuclease
MSEESRKLGDRKYRTDIELEEATDGTYCYVAYHPELPGCMSQGDTPEEAEENLREATQMVIEHLVSNNLPVPDPALLFSDFPAGQSFECVEEVRLVAPSMQIRPIAVPL